MTALSSNKPAAYGGCTLVVVSTSPRIYFQAYAITAEKPSFSRSLCDISLFLTWAWFPRALRPAQLHYCPALCCLPLLREFGCYRLYHQAITLASQGYMEPVTCNCLAEDMVELLDF